VNRILVSGRSADYVLQLESSIAELGDYDLATNVLLNGITDPLEAADERPDILVLLVVDNQLSELETLSRKGPADRVPLVVIGDALEPATMRLAMQAGARDFLSADTDENQLAETLRLLAAENEQQSIRTDCRVVSVINASGGDGASTIAVNLAVALAKEQTDPVAAIDLDLQYSSLRSSFDTQPGRSLTEALDRIEELDSTALSGYYVETSTGLDLACAALESEVHNRDALDVPFSKFLNMSTSKYGWIVIDVPNQIDALSATTLESSEHIVLVMQQNLKSIHQATAFLELIRQQLAIPVERVSLVVNRFHKSATLELADIKRVVKADPIYTVPNEFELVSKSNELGRPLYTENTTSRTAVAVRTILASFGVVDSPAKSNFIARGISALLRN